jgi:hypothetical protein
VVVAALPHNLDLNDPNALTAALLDFEPYAWQRTVDTRVHYPPIIGSKSSASVGGASVPLGYDPIHSVIRTMLEASTEDFRTGSTPGTAMQIVFPHHRAKMIAEDKAKIPLVDGRPKYTWRSVKGELQAYIGNTMVRELRTYGILPYMPNSAVDSAAPVNGLIPAEDIYDSLKNWFFKSEPELGGDPGSFARNIGTYLPFQNNTYAPNLAGVFESLLIADQLSHAPTLQVSDPQISSTTKAAVAAVMRDEALTSLPSSNTGSTTRATRPSTRASSTTATGPTRSSSRPSRSAPRTCTSGATKTGCETRGMSSRPKPRSTATIRPTT